MFTIRLSSSNAHAGRVALVGLQPPDEPGRVVGRGVDGVQLRDELRQQGVFQWLARERDVELGEVEAGRRHRSAKVNVFRFGRRSLRALDSALRLAQRLAERDDRRVIVLLDEFQDIASGRFGNSDTVTRRMRAVFQRSPVVSVLFAGSIEHLMRDLFGPSERALSQFGSFHELAPITDPEWGDGIRARLAADRTTIDDDALARLLELGEGHQRATMLIAQQAHMQTIEELRRTVDHAMVVVALDRALAAEQLRHQQQLERIRASSRHGERVAIRVAASAELYRGLAPQQASRALKALRDIGVVERAGRASWYVLDPLLRRYLAGRRIEPLSFVPALESEAIHD